MHTSDWHLGGVLHEQPRDHEHRAFLDWLLGILHDEEIDALLVAGDLFDRPNPSARTQSLFFNFVAAAKSRLPSLQLVVLPGDHDPGTRLGASLPLLATQGVYLLGRMDATEEGKPNLDRCLITLHGADGAPVAHLAALPCLRSRGVSPLDENPGQKLVESARSVYGSICEEAIRRAGEDGCASLAAGHVYVAGSQVVETPDSRISSRRLPALPADVFSPQLGYVALGHLHVGQSISDNVFYSGSPLALSFADSRHCQQVLIADFDGHRLAETRGVPAPRPVDLLRVPCDEPQPPEQVIDMLRQLERLEGRDSSSPTRPYLEVRVRLNAPRPGLRDEITREVDDKWPRLLRISLERQRTSEFPAREDSRRQWLDELNPEEIFRNRYQRKHSSPYTILNEPSDRLMQAFRLLCQEQEKGGGQ